MDGQVQEGKGRTDALSGLYESEKGDSREIAERKQGRAGRWSAGSDASWRMWRDGGGALAQENAKDEVKNSPLGPAAS